VILVTHGQTAFLLAGLLMLGALWLREHPVSTGIVFGRGNDQAAVRRAGAAAAGLTGEWRVITAAALSALALAGVSALSFGAGRWADWYALTRAAQTAMDAGTVGYAKMVSPFAAAMLLGIPAHLSYIVQSPISVTVAAVLAMVCWRRSHTPELGALMLVGAVLVTPFVLGYDLLLLVPAMIVIACRPHRSCDKLAVFLAFAAPAFAQPIGMNLHLPVVPELAFFLFWALWKRLRVSLASPAPTIERQSHA
jgi:hypothetical protein